MHYSIPFMEEPSPIRRQLGFLYIVLLIASMFVSLIFIVPFFVGSSSQQFISLDWSGYSVASDLNNPQPQVTSVNGSWIVPSVNVSIIDTFCAIWVGVGGQFDESLIQAGTEQDSINGQAEYGAWYELLPADSVTIDSLNVSPGDLITTSISLLDAATNTWSIVVRDVTKGQVFQTSVVYDSAMLSGEWILERPTVNNVISTLADFGQATFTGCTATMDGTVGTAKGFPSSQFIMYNRQNVDLVSVSSLSSDGYSFTINYLD